MSIVTLTRSDEETRNLHGWTGTINPLMPYAQPFRRLGGSGTELNMLGELAPDSNCNAVYFVAPGFDISNELAWFADCRFDYVTLLFPYDTTPLLVLCKQIQGRVIRGRQSYENVSYDYRIEFNFTFEAQ